MKKRLMQLILTAALFISLVPTVKAEETTLEVATYVTPVQTTMNDLPAQYDYMTTLRMTFPDAVFEENQKLIEEVLKGDRQKFSQAIHGNELKFLYEVKLYLLPYQLYAYKNEYNKIGVTNPILEQAYLSFDELPTQGKGELIRALGGK